MIRGFLADGSAFTSGKAAASYVRFEPVDLVLWHGLSAQSGDHQGRARGAPVGVLPSRERGPAAGSATGRVLPRVRSSAAQLAAARRSTLTAVVALHTRGVADVPDRVEAPRRVTTTMNKHEGSPFASTKSTQSVPPPLPERCFGRAFGSGCVGLRRHRTHTRAGSRVADRASSQPIPFNRDYRPEDRPPS